MMKYCIFNQNDIYNNIQHSNEKNENIVGKYIIHKPLTYGKKLYIIEFLAERFIQLTAFLSIAFIIAIFFLCIQRINLGILWK